MSLEGLRAWIGEVERKLGMRTRVFLVLTVIALGIGGAAIYLAIDARDNSVSESDVQALQEQLEAQIGTGAGSGAGVGAASVQLESELRALQAEVAELKSAGGKSKQGSKSGGAAEGAGAANESSGGQSSGGGSATQPSGGSSGSVTPGGGASSPTLKDSVEGAQQQSTEAGVDQSGN